MKIISNKKIQENGQQLAFSFEALSNIQERLQKLIDDRPGDSRLIANLSGTIGEIQAIKGFIDQTLKDMLF